MHATILGMLLCALGDLLLDVIVRTDVAVEPELSVWDVAALVAVVQEAGGRITGCGGGPEPAVRPRSGFRRG